MSMPHHNASRFRDGGGLPGNRTQRDLLRAMMTGNTAAGGGPAVAGSGGSVVGGSGGSVLGASMNLQSMRRASHRPGGLPLLTPRGGGGVGTASHLSSSLHVPGQQNPLLPTSSVLSASHNIDREPSLRSGRSSVRRARSNLIDELDLASDEDGDGTITSSHRDRTTRHTARGVGGGAFMPGALPGDYPGPRGVPPTSPGIRTRHHHRSGAGGGGAGDQEHISGPSSSKRSGTKGPVFSAARSSSCCACTVGLGFVATVIVLVSFGLLLTVLRVLPEQSMETIQSESYRGAAAGVGKVVEGMMLRDVTQLTDSLYGLAASSVVKAHTAQRQLALSAAVWVPAVNAYHRREQALNTTGAALPYEGWRNATWLRGFNGPALNASVRAATGSDFLNASKAPIPAISSPILPVLQNRDYIRLVGLANAHRWPAEAVDSFSFENVTAAHIDGWISHQIALMVPDLSCVASMADIGKNDKTMRGAGLDYARQTENVFVISQTDHLVGVRCATRNTYNIIADHILAFAYFAPNLTAFLRDRSSPNATKRMEGFQYVEWELPLTRLPANLSTYLYVDAYRRSFSGSIANATGVFAFPSSSMLLAAAAAISPAVSSRVYVDRREEVLLDPKEFFLRFVLPKDPGVQVWLTPIRLCPLAACPSYLNTTATGGPAPLIGAIVSVFDIASDTLSIQAKDLLDRTWRRSTLPHVSQIVLLDRGGNWMASTVGETFPLMSTYVSTLFTDLLTRPVVTTPVNAFFRILRPEKVNENTLAGYIPGYAASAFTKRSTDGWTQIFKQYPQALYNRVEDDVRALALQGGTRTAEFGIYTYNFVLLLTSQLITGALFTTDAVTAAEKSFLDWQSIYMALAIVVLSLLFFGYAVLLLYPLSRLRQAIRVWTQDQRRQQQQALLLETEMMDAQSDSHATSPFAKRDTVSPSVHGEDGSAGGGVGVRSPLRVITTDGVTTSPPLSDGLHSPAEEQERLVVSLSGFQQAQDDNITTYTLMDITTSPTRGANGARGGGGTRTGVRPTALRLVPRRDVHNREKGCLTAAVSRDMASDEDDDDGDSPAWFRRLSSWWERWLMRPACAEVLQVKNAFFELRNEIKRNLTLAQQNRPDGAAATAASAAGTSSHHLWSASAEDLDGSYEGGGASTFTMTVMRVPSRNENNNNSNNNPNKGAIEDSTLIPFTGGAPPAVSVIRPLSGGANAVVTSTDPSESDRTVGAPVAPAQNANARSGAEATAQSPPTSSMLLKPNHITQCPCVVLHIRVKLSSISKQRNGKLLALQKYLFLRRRQEQQQKQQQQQLASPDGFGSVRSVFSPTLRTVGGGGGGGRLAGASGGRATLPHVPSQIGATALRGGGPSRSAGPSGGGGGSSGSGGTIPPGASLETLYEHVNDLLPKETWILREIAQKVLPFFCGEVIEVNHSGIVCVFATHNERGGAASVLDIHRRALAAVEYVTFRYVKGVDPRSVSAAGRRGATLASSSSHSTLMSSEVGAGGGGGDVGGSGGGLHPPSIIRKATTGRQGQGEGEAESAAPRQTASRSSPPPQLQPQRRRSKTNDGDLIRTAVSAWRHDQPSLAVGGKRGGGAFSSRRTSRAASAPPSAADAAATTPDAAAAATNPLSPAATGASRQAPPPPPMQAAAPAAMPNPIHQRAAAQTSPPPFGPRLRAPLFRVSEMKNISFAADASHCYRGLLGGETLRHQRHVLVGDALERVRKISSLQASSYAFVPFVASDEFARQTIQLAGPLSGRGPFSDQLEVSQAGMSDGATAAGSSTAAMPIVGGGGGGGDAGSSTAGRSLSPLHASSGVFGTGFSLSAGLYYCPHHASKHTTVGGTGGGAGTATIPTGFGSSYAATSLNASSSEGPRQPSLDAASLHSGLPSCAICGGHMAPPTPLEDVTFVPIDVMNARCTVGFPRPLTTLIHAVVTPTTVLGSELYATGGRSLSPQPQRSRGATTNSSTTTSPQNKGTTASGKPPSASQVQQLLPPPAAAPATVCAERVLPALPLTLSMVPHDASLSSSDIPIDPALPEAVRHSLNFLSGWLTANAAGLKGGVEIRTRLCSDTIVDCAAEQVVVGMQQCPVPRHGGGATRLAVIAESPPTVAASVAGDASGRADPASADISFIIPVNGTPNVTPAAVPLSGTPHQQQQQQQQQQGPSHGQQLQPTLHSNLQSALSSARPSATGQLLTAAVGLGASGHNNNTNPRSSSPSSPNGPPPPSPRGLSPHTGPLLSPPSIVHTHSLSNLLTQLMGAATAHHHNHHHGTDLSAGGGGGFTATPAAVFNAIVARGVLHAPPRTELHMVLTLMKQADYDAAAALCADILNRHDHITALIGYLASQAQTHQLGSAAQVAPSDLDAGGGLLWGFGAVPRSPTGAAPPPPPPPASPPPAPSAPSAAAAAAHQLPSPRVLVQNASLAADGNSGANPTSGVGGPRSASFDRSSHVSTNTTTTTASTGTSASIMGGGGGGPLPFPTTTQTTTAHSTSTPSSGPGESSFGPLPAFSCMLVPLPYMLVRRVWQLLEMCNARCTGRRSRRHLGGTGRGSTTSTSASTNKASSDLHSAFGVTRRGSVTSGHSSRASSKVHVVPSQPGGGPTSGGPAGSRLTAHSPLHDLGDDDIDNPIGVGLHHHDGRSDAGASSNLALSNNTARPSGSFADASPTDDGPITFSGDQTQSQHSRDPRSPNGPIPVGEARRQRQRQATTVEQNVTVVGSNTTALTVPATNANTTAPSANNTVATAAAPARVAVPAAAPGPAGGSFRRPLARGGGDGSSGGSSSVFSGAAARYQALEAFGWDDAEMMQMLDAGEDGGYCGGGGAGTFDAEDVVSNAVYSDDVEWAMEQHQQVLTAGSGGGGGDDSQGYSQLIGSYPSSSSHPGPHRDRSDGGVLTPDCSPPDNIATTDGVFSPVCSGGGSRSDSAAAHVFSPPPPPPGLFGGGDVVVGAGGGGRSGGFVVPSHRLSRTMQPLLAPSPVRVGAAAPPHPQGAPQIAMPTSTSPLVVTHAYEDGGGVAEDLSAAPMEAME